MKTADFRLLIKTVMEGNLTLDGVIEIDGFDLSDLEPDQWKTLGKMIIQRKATGLQLSECKTHQFSNSTWQTLFAIIAQAPSMIRFTIHKDPLPQYTEATYDSLFTHMPRQITKLGLNFCDLGDITLSDYPALLNGLIAPQYEELDLSGNSFALPSFEKESDYPTLINTLGKAVQLKRLLLCSDSTFWSEDNLFWQMPEVNFTGTHFSFLALDCNPLDEQDKTFWLQFCNKISHSQISSLSLRSNNFYRFTPESWRWFFEGLAGTKVTELDIRDYHSLELNTEEKSATFFNELRHSKIITLHYITNNGGASQFTPEQETILKNILEANEHKLTTPVVDTHPHLMAATFAYNLRKNTKRQRLERTNTDESVSDEGANQNSPHNKT